ncbi:MAG: serine/threonine protein kinase [Planctomycetia bacterium]|nr:serine/threonine protein kinase [Planctomycetia bacterium]
MPIEFRANVEPIPGYKLIEPLGRGGFGEVWKAEAPGGVLKAIKLVHGSLRSGTGEEVLVQQELKALHCVRGVRHPYILAMDRFDIVDGQLLIVMELADHSLWDRYKEYEVQGEPGIPRDELLRYMEEAAEALDLMNIKYRLQHSDIKPQNLFLVHNHVKIADFGLVKDLKGMKALTSGCFSPIYAAPETFEGWVSQHSDQYSLAICWMELLTGVRPFDGKNARALLMQHMQAEPNLRALPIDDRPVIARSLAKKAAERFPTCMALVHELRRAGKTPPRPEPVPVAKPAAPPAPPSLTPAASAAAAGYQLTFAIRCPGCGYTGRVPKKFQGQSVKCRECATAFFAAPPAAAAAAPVKPTPAPPTRPAVPPTPVARPFTPSPAATPKPTPPAPASHPAAAKASETMIIRAPRPTAQGIAPVPASAPGLVKPPAEPLRAVDTYRPPLPSEAPVDLQAMVTALAPLVEQEQSESEEAIECPVCGHLRHGPADHQPGKLRCLQCGCVHGHTPAAPARHTMVPAHAATALKHIQVECGVCGHTERLPLDQKGQSHKCRQCGCVQRVE